MSVPMINTDGQTPGEYLTSVMRLKLRSQEMLIKRKEVEDEERAEADKEKEYRDVAGHCEQNTHKRQRMVSWLASQWNLYDEAEKEKRDKALRKEQEKRDKKEAEAREQSRLAYDVASDLLKDVIGDLDILARHPDTRPPMYFSKPYSVPGIVAPKIVSGHLRDLLISNGVKGPKLTLVHPKDLGSFTNDPPLPHKPPFDWTQTQPITDLLFAYSTNTILVEAILV